MESYQLALDLAPPRRLHFSNFLYTDCRAAVETLRRGLEPGAWYFVAGPAGCGKTHLAAAVFNQALEAGQQAQFLPAARLERATLQAMLESVSCPLLVLDDVDRLAGDQSLEEVLFHALNRWKADRLTLVMTGTGRNNFQLPDLKSRLGAATRLTLKLPDEALRRRILEQMAGELEMDLRPRALDYLLTHGPRNLRELSGLMETLRGRALGQRRGITVPLIKEVTGQ